MLPCISLHEIVDDKEYDEASLVIARAFFERNNAYRKAYGHMTFESWYVTDTEDYDLFKRLVLNSGVSVYAKDEATGEIIGGYTAYSWLDNKRLIEHYATLLNDPLLKIEMELNKQVPEFINVELERDPGSVVCFVSVGIDARYEKLGLMAGMTRFIERKAKEKGYRYGLGVTLTENACWVCVNKCGFEICAEKSFADLFNDGENHVAHLLYRDFSS